MHRLWLLLTLAGCGALTQATIPVGDYDVVATVKQDGCKMADDRPTTAIWTVAAADANYTVSVINPQGGASMPEAAVANGHTLTLQRSTANSWKGCELRRNFTTQLSFAGTGFTGSAWQKEFGLNGCQSPCETTWNLSGRRRAQTTANP